jgi:glyoxylase-like metal-dependent hydrolase (beta-lactamase superfamily II)
MPTLELKDNAMADPIPVLPDLFQITLPTPFPVGPVNVYVARDSDGLTLIDCGPATLEARATLDAGLAQLGRSARDIRRIIATHAHADHYGLAASLGGESGAQVLTHPFNHLILKAYADERKQRLAFYNDILQTSGMPGELCQTVDQLRRTIGDYAGAVQVTGSLNDGQALTFAGRVWQVLHTPGHSAGMICLYEPHSRVLLSSDHLLRDISSNPLVEPPPPGHTQRLKPLVEYITQLERVAAMDISTAWSGHGGPIENVPQLVRQRIAFHTRRAGRILELLNHPLTAYAIARPLFPNSGPFDLFLAVSEILGHLELLESEGRINSTQAGNVTVWQANQADAAAVVEENK